ncbi:MAG TPA: IS982 family transposase [Pseudonocardiaceae bacterium]|nr:IS982 family transposase [Pseudonocardiaceae bacterium]
MKTDIETLITALYVKIDDELVTDRWCGRPPLLSDSELVCLAVAQALLQVHNEARWLRFVGQRLGTLFPYRPKRPGYNKRLRAALPLVKRVIRLLARDTDFWLDTVWITDSTPVPCGMSRPTVKRSNLAGWAGYGYCASHSRFFWGLRLYLVCTPAGMPILWALANPKLGEREVLAAMLEEARDVVAEHPGVLMITDKGFAGRTFERVLSEEHRITLLRPSRKDETERGGEPLLKSVRQLIESVNDTLKGQLDLEQHGARTFEGVAIRVAQRILALACAIWHNFRTGQPVSRSLTAYDH